MASKITIRDVLQVPGLAGCRLISGSSGLDREVTCFMVGDTLDFADWVGEGAFVTTTVPFMMHTAEAPAPTEELLCRWVRSICENGPSGIGIKTMLLAEEITDPRQKYSVTVRTRRYLEELPDSLIAIGDEYGIPIIQMPAYAAQDKISRDVLQLLVLQHEEARKRDMEMFIDLCALIVEDHTLGNVADRLARYLGNPVVIENEDFELLAASDMTQPEMAQLLAARRQSGGLDQLRKQLQEDVNSQAHMEFPHNGRQISQQTRLVHTSNRIFGYMSVIEANAPMTDDAQNQFKMCTGAVALDMRQQTFLEIAAWQTRQQFLEMLSAPEFDEAVCQHMSGMLGFDERPEKTAMVISVRRGESQGQTDSPYYNYFIRIAIRSVSEYMRSLREKGFICGHKGNVVLFTNTERRDAQSIRKLACQLRDHLKTRQPDMDVAVGIGRRGCGLQACRASYLEALDAVQYVRDFEPSETVVRYDELGQYALLVAVIRNGDTARNYCQSILGGLIERDRQEHTDLMETLRVYLETNCSYVEAGKVMFLHPKTIKYRISQIRELLPVSLSNFNDRSAVWLALNVYKCLHGDT